MVGLNYAGRVRKRLQLNALVECGEPLAANRAFVSRNNPIEYWECDFRVLGYVDVS